jgi:hypothetical protein
MGNRGLKSLRAARPAGAGLTAAACGLAAVLLLLSSCESPLRTRIKTLTEAYVSINQEKAIYVDAASGDDSNPGTQELPKKTIQAGIDFVISFLRRGTVKVKNGTYLQTDKLVIKEGASIEGGYSDGWVRQDLIMEDTQTIVQGRDAASGADSIVTAQTEPGVTSSTLISGISFETGIGNQSMTLVVKNSSPFFEYCIVSGNGGIGETIALAVLTQSGFAQRSQPVFFGCLIQGGVCTGNTYAVQATGDTTVTFEYSVISARTSTDGGSYGIYFVGCEVDALTCYIVGNLSGAGTTAAAVGVYAKNGILNLEGCHVMGGNSGPTTVGVYAENCSGYVRNTTVYGGKGTSASTGVLLTGTSLPYVRNCTINAGASTGGAYGLIAYSSGALIENCIIWSDNLASWSCGVAMYGVLSETTPSALNNCDFFNTIYWYGYTPDNNTTWYCYNATTNGGITGLQNHLTPGVASGNISLSNVGFVSTAVDMSGSNWALTSSSPVAIKSGGKNLHSLFTTDKAGATRPAGGNWSMGAYQYP